MEGQSHCHLLLCAGLSLFVFFRYCLLHIVCGMGEGEAGEEIWHGLIIYSSFLLLRSVGSINILALEPWRQDLFLNIHYLVALGINCGTWDLVPQPGMEPGGPALGA